MLNRLLTVDNIRLQSAGAEVSTFLPFDSSSRKLPKEVVIRATGNGAYVRLSDDRSAATTADMLVQSGDHVVCSVAQRRWVSVLAASGSTTVSVGALSTGVGRSVAEPDPFAQSGPVLDLVFAGVASDPLNAASTADDTLELNFVAQAYQSAAQYAVWGWGTGGLQQVNFADIVTFTRASTATYFNSAGTLTSAAINEARFDYDPATLLARGFLIEEARTNLMLQSADFATTWTQTNVTITANTTASPDGGTNGDTLLINATGALTSQTTQAFAAGSTITVSVFAKKNASNFVRFELGGVCSCWFNLDTGVTATNNAGSGNVLFSSKSIQAISNGWYRCVLTVTTSTITTLSVAIFATNADGVSSSINSSIFLWGAQAEGGAFPTSYIPTTTTALTRSADVASVNTLSPWYNATEGTLYVQAQDMSDAPHATSQPRAVSINNGTTSNCIDVSRLPASAQGRARVDDAGVNQFNSLNSAWPLATQAKVALAYKANDFAACLGGGTVFTDTSGTVPAVTTLSIGNITTGGSNSWVGWIQRLTFYPRRLSNADLQTITA